MSEWRLSTSVAKERGIILYLYTRDFLKNNFKKFVLLFGTACILLFSTLLFKFFFIITSQKTSYLRLNNIKKTTVNSNKFRDKFHVFISTLVVMLKWVQTQKHPPKLQLCIHVLLIFFSLKSFWDVFKIQGTTLSGKKIGGKWPNFGKTFPRLFITPRISFANQNKIS